MKKTFIAFLFFLNASNYLYSQVGIATTTPQGALDVVSANDGFLIPRIALTAANVATVTTPTISELIYNTATAGVAPNNVTPGFYYWNGTTWIKIAIGINSDWSLLGNAGTSPATNFVGTTDVQDLVLKTNNLDRLHILSNGNVGIGNTNPGQLLTVAGTVSIQDMFASGGQNLVVGDDTFFSDVDVAHRLGLISTSNANIGELKLGNSATNPILSGNVGYLSIDQEVRIQNNSNVFRRSARPNLFTDQFDIGLNGVHLSNGEVEEGGFWANGNYSMIYSPGDNDLVKFVDEDGFDNAGTAYDGTAIRARIDGGGAYFQVSDANAKENIVKITDGLKKVLTLNGYTYDFKLLPGEIEKKSKPIHSAGILAQEVEKVLPEAVSNQDGHYMVNYATFVPLFIEAIKEQESEINKLKREIQEIKSLLLQQNKN